MPGVYVSYPFCSQKCSFCNFASGVSPQATVLAYERALLTELTAHQWDWWPETLYFGGGTPSLMTADFLRKIIGLVPGQEMGEITLECAPGTITEEAAAFWYSCGINRISLGVQSFVTAELRRTGRKHHAGIVAREIGILRQRGISNINVDLIAGLPGQTPASWQQSLDWIERLQPPHVSVYIFEVDEDSRLGKEMLLGGVRYGAAQAPCEDLVAEFYERAVERLAALGIHRYEISNFARRGFESKHNLKYWLLQPYVGFGLDAHSFDGKQRWNNPDMFAAYLGWHERTLSATDAAEEHFFVGLRLMDGIEPNPDEWLRFAGPIARWLEAGMLEREGSRLRLSPAGVLLSNEVFQEFIGA